MDLFRPTVRGTDPCSAGRRARAGSVHRASPCFAPVFFAALRGLRGVC